MSAATAGRYTTGCVSFFLPASFSVSFISFLSSSLSARKAAYSSGRFSFVRINCCFLRQRPMRAWSPFSRISGTLRPSQTSGLVY